MCAPMMLSFIKILSHVFILSNSELFGEQNSELGEKLTFSHNTRCYSNVVKIDFFRSVLQKKNLRVHYTIKVSGQFS